VAISFVSFFCPFIFWLPVFFFNKLFLTFINPDLNQCLNITTNDCNQYAYCTNLALGYSCTCYSGSGDGVSCPGKSQTRAPNTMPTCACDALLTVIIAPTMQDFGAYVTQDSNFLIKGENLGADINEVVITLLNTNDTSDNIVLSSCVLVQSQVLISCVTPMHVQTAAFTVSVVVGGQPSSSTVYPPDCFFLRCYFGF
jgi:hypothetical protein